MLRKTTITSLIFLVFLVISLGAYTNTSFRNATTAYLLEDDYDFWLGPYPLPDPARLPLLDGARLYTNLSNLVNKSEEVFSNSSTDYFLIGGSTTPLFNYANLGLVIDRFNERDPWNTYLYDMEGNPMFGYGHVVHEELYDDDFNGIYDRRIDIEETAEAWYDKGEKDFVFCLGKDFDGWLGGLFYRLNTQSIEEFPYDSEEPAFPRNYTYDYTETSLDSIYTIYTETYVGTGSIKDDFSENLFGLSFWKYLNDTRAVGVHFGYGMISGEILDVADIAEDWNVNPGDTITDTYSLVIASEENVPYSGNSMTGWLSYIDDWNEITHLRFDGYYQRRSTDIDSDAHRNYSFVDATNASDGSTESNNNAETVGITGDASSQIISIAGKIIYDLTDRVTFAFGAGFSMSSMDSSRRESSNYRYVYTYNDGDTVSSDPDDYVSTTTYSDSVQGDGSYSTNSLRFPVCVEWHVTKPVVFRLGAIHTISHSDETLDMDLLGYTAATEITVYGDGTADTTLLDNPKIDDIQTGEDNKTSSRSSTSFTYGMGYAVSENLQIDLMGFSDLTKLYNWRVSATMKFY